MTNEQEKAKELAKLLTAFADGKTIQYEYKGKWHNCQDNMWGIHDMSVKYNTRIKPETKRIALNQQDLIERRKLGFEAMWVKSTQDFDYEYIIEQIRPDGCMVHGTLFAYEDFGNYFVWFDNSPCYKEVECE